MNLNTIYIKHIFIHDFTLESLNLLISKLLRKQEKVVISNHNLHSIYLCIKNKEFSSFFKKFSSYTFIDGVGVILLSKILMINKPLTKENRITYLDWAPYLFKILNDNKANVFYLGSDETTLQKAVQKIKKNFPLINFKTHNGFFIKNDEIINNAIIQEINSNHTNVLFVGMGMPTQELWIQSNYNKIKCDIILPCGAFFEYFGEKQLAPPRIFSKLNIEWLFRLVTNPKKMWKRYLIEPLVILYYFAIKK